MFPLILNKPQLFFPLTDSLLNPYKGYIHCPVTGHIYCLTNGCLYQTSPVIPLPTFQPQIDIPETQKPTLPKPEKSKTQIKEPVRKTDQPELLIPLKTKNKSKKTGKRRSKKKKKLKNSKPSKNLELEDTKPAATESKPIFTTHKNLPKKDKPKRRHARTFRKQKYIKKKINAGKKMKMTQEIQIPITRPDQQSFQKSIRFRPRKVRSPPVWSYVAHFNWRSHAKSFYHRCKRKSPWEDRCKNRILASSVHDIIHSPYAKDTSEAMPVPQLRLLLHSGSRKLDKQQMKYMENDAILMYRKVHPERNVLEYDLASHLHIPWLLGFSRWVIDQSTNETWPLLMKHLYKYPDGKIRLDSSHRSFCLSWDGVSYALKRDHAYYTEIQCLLAITDLPCAELLLYTHKETATVPVYFDADFWKEAEIKLQRFFTKNVLPHLRKRNETKVEDLYKLAKIENKEPLNDSDCYIEFR